MERAQLTSTTAGPAASGAPMIRVRGLVKRYGHLTAVDGVDLEVRDREIFGILGPNGAGKTTTLEMIEGLREPDSGSIEVDGIDAVKHPTQVKRVIGIQLQTTALFDHLTVRELVGLFADLYDADSSKKRIDWLIGLVSLEEKAGSYVNELSGGQQQRLSIALALVNDPRVVFLDEPTTGLDPQARRNLWEAIAGIRNSGKTVVLTTHYMEEAEILCDRVAVMDAGRIIACDTPRDLIEGLNLGSTILARVSRGTVSLDELRRLPAVTDAHRDGDQLSLRTGDVAATVSALLLAAEREGWHLEDLTMTRASLEDVFLHYTGRSLRE